MRILAVDYGDARTGIAVSDLTGTLAGDAWVVKDYDMNRVADTIIAAAKERGAGTIVLGYPRNMDGSEGFRAEKSRALAAIIKEKSGIEPVLWDERLTTVDAHRILSTAGKRGKARKETVDAVAATLILESYLDSRR